jgi:dynein light intermediate chain, axonemal
VEQGYLLLRIRDEARLTMAAYQTLFESSVSFGMRRALIAEEEHPESKIKLVQVEKSKQDLEKEIQVLKFKIERAETRHLELISNQRRKNYEEINLAKKMNYQLKMQIDGILLAKQ